MIKHALRGSFALLAMQLLSATALAQNTLSNTAWNTLPFTDFSTLEAVDSTGSPTYVVTNPVMVEGIVLNNPADMTDSQAGNPNGTNDPAQPPTSIPFDPNPYWQVFVQSVDINHDGDFGGSAVYAAQNYGNIPPNLTFTGPNGAPEPDPSDSYTAEGWYEDVQRISTGVVNNVNSLPAVTNSPIVAGDLVIVEALGGLSFGGKMILNEEHEVSPDTQFQFINLGYVGLPTAAPVHLADIWDNTNDVVAFDQTRQSGGERFESTLVQLDDVELVSGQAANWQSNGFVTVQDSFGRQFTVELGTSAGFTPSAAPTGWFDVTGIFDKESPSSGTANTTGYQLWVMDPTTVVAVPYSPSYTWTNNTGGTFTLNNSSNWIEGSAPGGTNSDQLTFGNAAANSYVATVDGTQGAWTTNNLTFVNVSGVAGTIAAANGGSLIFAGLTPSITQLGEGPVVISAPIRFNVSGSISGNGSGSVTLSGPLTLANSITLQQSFTGAVEIDAAPTFNTGSAVQINGGSMKFNLTGGSSTVGTGVTVTVGAAATLQLAGTVSALSDPNSGNRANIVNNGSNADGGGLLATGTNQTVGSVTGALGSSNGATIYAGDTVVGDGTNSADLAANQILQNSLMINAGATVMIAPTGSTIVIAASPLATVEAMARSGTTATGANAQTLLAVDQTLAAAEPDVSVSQLDANVPAMQAAALTPGSSDISSEELVQWLVKTDRIMLRDTSISQQSLADIEGNALFGSSYSLLLSGLGSHEAASGVTGVPEPPSFALLLAASFAIGGFVVRGRRRSPHDSLLIGS